MIRMSRVDNKSILFYELIGIIFIVFLGSMLHFTFELSGRQAIVGFFSAVNESVWEHLKLGYWPALLYTTIEYRYIKKSTKNFFISKTVGIYLIPIAIIILFYSYTAVLGEDLLIMDILTFILSVIIGQISSYKLLISKEKPEELEKISFIALILLGVIFVIFTFYPPHIPLFRDPISGEYGIIKHIH